MLEDAMVTKFLYAPTPGEINLIEKAREALVTAGIGAGISIFDNDQNIIIAKNQNINVQRFKLNTFLDTQYMSLNTDVSQERSMLLVGGDPMNWLKLFCDYHIPTMKKLGLPKAYPV